MPSTQKTIERNSLATGGDTDRINRFSIVTQTTCFGVHWTESAGNIIR